MELTLAQKNIQAIFKQFMTELMKDAATHCEGGIQIKTDLSLGVMSQLQMERAKEYGKVMNQIISVAKELDQKPPESSNKILAGPMPSSQFIKDAAKKILDDAEKSKR